MKKTVRYTGVALQEKERNYLERIAEQDVRNMSAAMRWLILEEARRRGWLKDEAVEHATDANDDNTVN